MFEYNTVECEENKGSEAHMCLTSKQFAYSKNISSRRGEIGIGPAGIKRIMQYSMMGKTGIIITLLLCMSFQDDIFDSRTVS